MPYEVTAARKRPQSFEQLAGQEFVAATLEKSLETGRIAHAYLFSGPRGCGKTSTARILAKALNCEKGPTAEPCGVCDSCKSITAGSSLDVIEIDGASNTSVENVRQIKDEVLFPPNSSRYKIYIIDEVHMLSTSAFNALLKTIEEPPHYVIFMFATTEPHKVPATIKSRCQQFTFRLVASDVIVGLLATAAADIDVAAETEALLWIARESGGSVRDAYTLFDQVVSFAEGRITAALIREKLGLVGQDRMNALFGMFVAGDTAGSLSSLDAILGGGVSPEQFVADSVEYCRALLLVKNGITRESILGAPLSSFDLGITEALSGERIERILSIFLGTYRNLKESIDPRYELDLAVAKASHIGSYVPPSDVVRAVGALRRYLEKNAPAAGEQRQPPSHVASPVVAPAAAQVSAQAATKPSWAPDARPAAPVGAERTEAAQGRASAPVTVAAAAPVMVATASASVAPVNLPSVGYLDPAKLPELKKALVADIRKSNVLLATTLDKSHSWQLKDDVLQLSVSTQMECDLLRRFLGIVAEVLAQRLGSSKKINVILAGTEKPAGDGQEPDDSPFDIPGVNAGSAPQGIENVAQGTAGSVGKDSSRDPGRDSRLPGAFNERPREEGSAQRGEGGSASRGPASTSRGSAGAAPPQTPQREPQLSLHEREAIGLVERLFKGTLEGYARASPATLAVPASSATLATPTAPADLASDPVLDENVSRTAANGPDVYEDEIFE